MIQNRYRKAGFVPNVVQRSNDLNTIQSMLALGVESVAAWNKNNQNPLLEKFISII